MTSLTTSWLLDPLTLIFRAQASSRAEPEFAWFLGIQVPE